MKNKFAQFHEYKIAKYCSPKFPDSLQLTVSIGYQGQHNVYKVHVIHINHQQP